MAKRMTQKRKAELYEECLNWIFDHSADNQAYKEVLIRIGMTEEEITSELKEITGE